MENKGEIRLNTDALRAIQFQKGVERVEGQKKEYVEMLSLFAYECDAKRTSLTQLYQQEQWGDYLLEIHRLRMSAFFIGANALAQAAQRTERVCLERLEDKREGCQGEVLTEYEEVGDEIREFLEENELWMEKEGVVLPVRYMKGSQAEKEKEDSIAAREKDSHGKERVEEKKLRLYIQEICDNIDNFDKEMAQNQIEHICQYNLQAEIRECMVSAKKNLDYYQYDKALEECKKAEKFLSE